jgi:hypothetical protein
MRQVGATGIMVQDYRGKNGEQVVWKFDAPLPKSCNSLASKDTPFWVSRRSS